MPVIACIPVKPVVVNAEIISKYKVWLSNSGRSDNNGSVKIIGKIKKLVVITKSWLRIGRDNGLLKLVKAINKDISKISNPK